MAGQVHPISPPMEQFVVLFLSPVSGSRAGHLTGPQILSGPPGPLFARSTALPTRTFATRHAFRDHSVVPHVPERGRTSIREAPMTVRIELKPGT